MTCTVHDVSIQWNARVNALNACTVPYLSVSTYIHTKIALLEMNIDVCSSACVCRYCRNWPEPAPAPLPQQQPWELSQGNDTHQDHAADDADVTSMGIFAGCCSSVLTVWLLAAYFIHGSWPSRIEHLLALKFIYSI